MEAEIPTKMSKVAIYTDKAPKPRPVYNQAIVANGLVFCSGQLPKDLEGKIVEGTVQDRTVSSMLHTRSFINNKRCLNDCPALRPNKKIC